MNSLQKLTLPQSVTSSEDYVSHFETLISKMTGASDVEIIMKKLKFLGLNFDPFGAEISSECSLLMEDVGLNQFLNNPYQLTNILLRLLDITEERLNNLKH